METNKTSFCDHSFIIYCKNTIYFGEYTSSSFVLFMIVVYFIWKKFLRKSILIYLKEMRSPVQENFLRKFVTLGENFDKKIEMKEIKKRDSVLITFGQKKINYGYGFDF